MASPAIQLAEPPGPLEPCATRYALPSGECSILRPKSTTCGAPIRTRSPLTAVSLNNGLAGVCGASVQLLPPSVETRKPTNGPNVHQFPHDPSMSSSVYVP